jgi:multidrug efflux pump subunit AcrA (membrane-fusion protein)
MGASAWILSAFCFLPAAGLAHEGHSHGEEPPEQTTRESGPVILTEEARRNLDIRTAEATVQPIERTVKASGIIQAIPGSRENVSSKIPGKVTHLTAALGEYKRKGEPLLVLEARQLAEVPVRVPVTAPRNGKVVKIDVIKGDAVEPGTSLLEITTKYTRLRGSTKAKSA